MEEPRQSPAQSPVHKPSPDTVFNTMTFFDALKKVADGKRITKLEWHDEDIYGLMGPDESGNIILQIRRDNAVHKWIVSYGDMVGEDYYVLP